MEEVLTSTSAAQWTVSARSAGDVLAVRARGPGLELGFLGAPPGFTGPEIETWLTELIGVAGSTGGDSPARWDPAASTPIPCVLHQALTGLLFYEAELWAGSAGRHPCAIACLAGAGGIAFGWTGSARVELLLDGRPFEPAWLLVRDQEGRDARAFIAEARLPLLVRLSWPGDAEQAEGEIEARWPGSLEGAAATGDGSQPAGVAGSERGSSEEAPVEPEPRAVEDAGPSAAQPRGFWHFRGWMDRLAGRGERQDTQPLAVSPPEPIAHDVPGVPDLVPEPEAVLAGEPVIEELPPAPVVAEAPVVEDLAIAPVVAEAPVVEELAIALAVAEAPVAEHSPPAPAVAEAPVVEQRACEPVAEEPLTAECTRTVDPFDYGPLAAIEPELEPTPQPAAAEPLVDAESAQGPGPAVGEPVTAVGPQPEAGWESLAAEATGTEPVQARPRPVVRRPVWPEPEELAKSDGRPLWQRRWFVAAVVVALFAAGWSLGRVDFSRGGIGSALKAIGLGPARYEVTVNSRPSGAWITVDGVDQARRTPATLELKPGAHEIVLSFSGVGGSSHAVNGRRGQHVALDVELWGALKVSVPGGSVPISVAVDGMQRGYAPLDVDRLQPGIHRLQFSGPGVAPWEQTVEVHVNRTAEVVAQPIASPATGLLEVRATLADQAGSEPLTGAQVWIDGQPRGVTPLKLELPRGPHSIRVRFRNEEGPVQVIELPGGNLRYATIELGLNLDAQRLVAALPERIMLGRPTVLSASLDRASVGDVREMWLHVRTPEGAWRRYPMSMMKAPGGLVGVAVFPTVLFDARGRTAWYVSALTPMGDEYFTEIQPAQSAAGQ